MALENTLSENVLRASLRRFFVDVFYTGQSIEVFFDKIGRIPKVAEIEIDRWMSIHFDQLDLATMASTFLQIWCFTRRDVDFVELAILRDIVYSELIDLGQTDGMKRIPLYDSSWTIIGHGLFIPQSEYGPEEIEDGTNAKIVPVTFRWGAK